MSEPNSPEPNRMRASDHDRDSVAHRLREALAEGRIDPDEHSERLDAVYRAKTVGELVPLTEDLPATEKSAELATPAGFRSPRPVYGGGRVVGAEATSRVAIAVMGGADRSGSWVVPETYVCATAMGGVNLDLREARFTHRETTIWTFCLMGGAAIIAPNDIQVRVHGLPIMGGFAAGDGQPGVVDPDAPIVHIRGIAVMGGVGVEYRPREHQDDTDD